MNFGNIKDQINSYKNNYDSINDKVSGYKNQISGAFNY